MQNRKTPPGGSVEQGTEVASSKTKATIGRDVQSKIGEQLRAMYDDVVSQGVPDRFADLLKQLDEQRGGGESA